MAEILSTNKKEIPLFFIGSLHSNKKNREKWLKKLLSNIGGNIAGELFPIIGKSGGKVREK